MAKPPSYTTESDVKRDVKKLLNTHRWFWWMPSNNGYGVSGVSDFCALRGGVFLAIETKFDKRKPTAMQKGFLQSVEAEHGFAFVVNEHRLEALRLWLEAFDRSVAATSKNERPTDEDGALMLDCIGAMTREF